MKQTYQLFVMLCAMIFVPFLSVAQCTISDVTAEVTACEGNDFDVVIDFNYDEVSNTFDILGNGQNYGTFEYGDVPITLTTLEADCITEYEFVIQDNGNNDCSSFVELGTVCCTDECQITSIDFGPNPICEEGLIVTEWFIFSENTSEVGFDIFINNEFITFVEYNGEGPYDFDIEEPGTEYFTIKVCDNDNEDCCYSWDVLNPCFDECSISELITDVVVCEDDQFNISIDFEYSGTSETFSIVGNGQSYGTFNYEDVPVTLIGLDADCELSYEFVIIDDEIDGCESAIDHGVVCCDQSDCELWDLQIVTSDCEEGAFTIEIDFNYEGTTNEFFDYSVPGEVSGFAAFEDLPLVLTIENTTDDGLTLLINENDNESCSVASDFTNPCYESNSECAITQFEVDGDLECSDPDVAFGTWLISGVNLSELYYDVYLEGEFLWTMNYEEDGSYELEFQIENTPYFTVEICDYENENCCITAEFLNPCYDQGNEDCSITELTAEVTACEGDLFDVEINFEHANTTSMFQIVGNGNDYGLFSYDDLPVTLTSLEADCELEYEFVIIDNDLPDCSADTGIGTVCCDDMCDITTVDVIGDLECISNEVVYGTWFITAEGGNEEGFDIYVDNEFVYTITQSDNDEYIMEFFVPNTEYFTWKVCVTENEDCCFETEYLNPCYDGSNEDCSITELTAEVTACEGDLFDVEINFEHTNTTSMFQIVGNGNDYGLFSYDDLPVTLTSLEADCELEYEFVIIDNDLPDCSADTGIGVVCCDDEEECAITQFEVLGDLSCEEPDVAYGTWLISGVNLSELYYDVYLEGEYIWTMNYEEDGEYLLEFQLENTPYFTVKICDNDSEDCCITGEFLNPCYEQNSDECNITELTADVTACEEDLFDVEINFEHTNTTSMFQIVGNGNDYGLFSYDDLPVTLTNLEADCELEYEFVIIDNDLPDCSADTGIGVVCCDDMCEIVTAELEGDLECIGELVYGTWLIVAEGGNEDGFDIFVEDEYLHTFSLNDTDMYTMGFFVSNTEYFTWKVCVAEDEDCCYETEYLNPCYTDTNECTINDLSAEVTACEGDVFDVEINFNHTNTTNTFTILGNGNNYGTFDYNDVPVTLTGLDADCELEYEFVIVDSVIDGCESDIDLGVVCCDDIEECNIISIDFDENPICDEGIIVAEWLILAENDSEVGFDIFINDVFAVFVEHEEDDWYDFDIEDPGTQFITVTACDNDNENCCYSIEIENPCFEENFLILPSVNLGEPGVFFLRYEFDKPTDCDYTVFVDGEELMPISNGDSNYELGPFECGNQNEITVTLKNNCTGFVFSFTEDLGEFSCSTSTDDELAVPEIMWNMSSHTLLVSNETKSNLFVSIYSLSGELVHQELVNETLWRHSLVEHPSNMFLLDVKDKKGKTLIIKKLINIR